MIDQRLEHETGRLEHAPVQPFFGEEQGRVKPGRGEQRRAFGAVGIACFERRGRGRADDLAVAAEQLVAGEQTGVHAVPDAVVEIRGVAGFDQPFAFEIEQPLEHAHGFGVVLARQHAVEAGERVAGVGRVVHVHRVIELRERRRGDQGPHQNARQSAHPSADLGLHAARLLTGPDCEHKIRGPAGHNPSGSVQPGDRPV